MLICLSMGRFVLTLEIPMVDKGRLGHAINISVVRRTIQYVLLCSNHTLSGKVL